MAAPPRFAPGRVDGSPGAAPRLKARAFAPFDGSSIQVQDWWILATFSNKSAEGCYIQCHKLYWELPLLVFQRDLH